jgi:hypothetical protein
MRAPSGDHFGSRAHAPPADCVRRRRRAPPVPTVKMSFPLPKVRSLPTERVGAPPGPRSRAPHPSPAAASAPVTSTAPPAAVRRRIRGPGGAPDESPLAATAPGDASALGILRRECSSLPGEARPPRGAPQQSPREPHRAVRGSDAASASDGSPPSGPASLGRPGRRRRGHVQPRPPQQEHRRAPTASGGGQPRHAGEVGRVRPTGRWSAGSGTEQEQAGGDFSPATRGAIGSNG